VARVPTLILHTGNCSPLGEEADLPVHQTVKAPAVVSGWGVDPAPQEPG